MSEVAKASPTAPRKLKDITQWDFETDVAIVGFGGAGACAAIEAADAGSDVMIFEVASESGGSTKLSSAEIYMGGNGGTPPQQASGFNDESEDMIQYLLMAGGPQADEKKVRAYVEGSLDHYHWITGLGVPYKMSFHEKRDVMCLTDDCLLYTGSEKAWPFVEKAKPCPRGHNIEVEGDNGGPLLVGILTDQVEKRDKIDVHYETRVVTLIADENNDVHGLVIRQNMKEYNVKARKGVILCAGGFVMNDEMLQKYAPQLLRATYKVGNPGDMGTGIMMGMGVGAAAINMNEGFVSLPFYPPAETTYGILVNSAGQRFINEDCYHGRVGFHLMQQLGDRVYMIFTATDDWKPPSFLFADIAGTGETIKELEEELNLPEGTLQHTMAYYNKNAADGKDPQFHKSAEYLAPLEPPYAALDCTPGRGAFFPYFTLGGLDTLPSGEVLTPEGKPIKGLYAAGRTTAGIPRTGAGYSSGMSVGDATFFGRQAGIQVAKQNAR
ncbi:Fumarate reductase flavoprotein subunit [BD1-7 clade bacterium]|uniref:Fumarate reductase flavoprotein subunit n=1 Tax=BD1-7 clade bacterium TaxID=2029982 RepID=A0A5S9PB71_9GAMM|nr:Fumarate reductase flavoprotein subunit [BD1-7 clade bacterium]